MKIIDIEDGDDDSNIKDFSPLHLLCCSSTLRRKFEVFPQATSSEVMDGGVSADVEDQDGPRLTLASS